MMYNPLQTMAIISNLYSFQYSIIIKGVHDTIKYWQLFDLKRFKQQLNLKKPLMHGQQLGDILHHEQIKELIKKLIQIDIKDYGSLVWFKQDESLQKLNMQLHVNAIMKNDQYILEEFIVQEKFKSLIVDLIITATWKDKVLGEIIKGSGNGKQIEKLNSLKLYLAIYHEAVVMNILEVFMFHRTAVDESGELLIEIIDYCYKKISKQIGKSIKERKLREAQEKEDAKLTPEERKQKKIQKIMKKTSQEQLQDQIDDIQFSLFIMSISVLRYITDYVKYLQIGIVHHLIAESNIYAVLVPLIEERPWLRTTEKGQREIFQNNRWAIVPKSEYGKLPKTEAQVWICIFNLFMDAECRKKYELNDQRKNMLLRLRKFMNEVLLDQIPNLSAMLRSLQELSMMNVPSNLTTNPFVVQQVPVIYTNICNSVQSWKELAEKHKERLKQSMDQSQRNHMQSLADLYSNNSVEGLLDGFKCAKCEKEAFKRCSKCKSVWYCSRDCQVGHWPQHKAKCNQKAKQMKEAALVKESQKQKFEIAQPAAKNNLIDELD